MGKKESLAVSLSQEELFVILGYLEVSSMMGLDGSVLDDLGEDRIRLVLGVAERALVARGFLAPGESDNFKLDPTILAIAVTCATPEHTLVVTQNRPDKLAQAHFFHTARKMVVEHTIPASSIHQFIVLKDREAMVQSALSILAPDFQDALSCPCGRVPEYLVTQARDAALQGGQAAALSVLAQTKLEPVTAEQFSLTLAHPLANATMVYIEHQEQGEMFADGFTVLQGTNGAWILRPVEDSSLSEEYVLLKPASTAEISQEFKMLVGS